MGLRGSEHPSTTPTGFPSGIHFEQMSCSESSLIMSGLLGLETDRQSMFDAGYRMLGDGALG